MLLVSFVVSFHPYWLILFAFVPAIEWWKLTATNLSVECSPHCTAVRIWAFCGQFMFCKCFLICVPKTAIKKYGIRIGHDKTSRSADCFVKWAHSKIPVIVRLRSVSACKTPVGISPRKKPIPPGKFFDLSEHEKTCTYTSNSAENLNIAVIICYSLGSIWYHWPTQYHCLISDFRWQQ